MTTENRTKVENLVSSQLNEWHWKQLWNIFTAGIDFDLPGNGGQECLDYLPMKQRLQETFLGLVLILLAFMLGKEPSKVQKYKK